MWVAFRWLLSESTELALCVPALAIAWGGWTLATNKEGSRTASTLVLAGGILWGWEVAYYYYRYGLFGGDIIITLAACVSALGIAWGGWTLWTKKTVPLTAATAVFAGGMLWWWEVAYYYYGYWLMHEEAIRVLAICMSVVAIAWGGWALAT